jgi:hypothetical protein
MKMITHKMLTNKERTLHWTCSKCGRLSESIWGINQIPFCNYCLAWSTWDEVLTPYIKKADVLSYGLRVPESALDHTITELDKTGWDYEVDKPYEREAHQDLTLDESWWSNQRPHHLIIPIAEILVKTADKWRFWDWVKTMGFRTPDDEETDK